VAAGYRVPPRARSRWIEQKMKFPKEKVMKDSCNLYPSRRSSAVSTRAYVESVSDMIPSSKHISRTGKGIGDYRKLLLLNDESFIIWWHPRTPTSVIMVRSQYVLVLYSLHSAWFEAFIATRTIPQQTSHQDIASKPCRLNLSTLHRQ
jgi:hypothetical protein